MPIAKVALVNPQGKFTNSNSSNYLADHGIIRIRADVGNGLDTLAYGRIFGKNDNILTGTPRLGMGEGFGEGFGLGSGTFRSKLELTIHDIVMQKLMEETKSYPNNQGYNTSGLTCMQAISHFLAYPDSGEDTNVGVYINAGLIESITFPNDPKRVSLFDLMRNACEASGYDGYSFIYTNTVLAIQLFPIGYTETNPQIWLTDPFAKITPQYDIGEVVKNIFIWGGIDLGTPADGDTLWTENPTSTWTANGTCTVDANNTEHAYIGSKSVKVSNSTYEYSDATCDLTSEYGDVVDCSYLSGYTYGRFAHVEFYIYHEQGASYPQVICYLGDGTNWIKHTSGDDKRANPNQWTRFVFTNLGEEIGANNYWIQESGSGFDWTNVTYVRIYHGYDPAWWDGLTFYGGLEIDPTKYPTLNPMVTTDATYGKTYHHVDDKGIRTFETAQSVSAYLANIMDTPIKKVVATKSAYTWAQPQQYVRLYQPEHNIGYTEKWKILELVHQWNKAQGNKLRTTFTLLKRPDLYESKQINKDALAGILKAINS